MSSSESISSHGSEAPESHQSLTLPMPLMPAMCPHMVLRVLMRLPCELFQVNSELKTRRVYSRAATAARARVFTRPSHPLGPAAVARAFSGASRSAQQEAAWCLLEFAAVSARDRADVQDAALPAGPAALLMEHASDHPGAMTACAAVLTRPFLAASTASFQSREEIRQPTRRSPAALVRANTTPCTGCGT
jgi:hypothetical protein